MSDLIPGPSTGDFLFYATEDGIARVRLFVDGRAVWMPQRAIAELRSQRQQSRSQSARDSVSSLGSRDFASIWSTGSSSTTSG